MQTFLRSNSVDMSHFHLLVFYLFICLFSLPVLGEDKIRVLVFRECEKKSDKTLLFDSDAIIVTDAVSLLQWNKHEHTHTHIHIHTYSYIHTYTYIHT